MSTKTDFDTLRKYFNDVLTGSRTGDPKAMLEIIDDLEGYMGYIMGRSRRIAEEKSGGEKCGEDPTLAEIRALHNELAELSKEIAEIKDLHDELNKLIAENETLKREQAELQQEIDRRNREGFPFINPINPPPIPLKREPVPWWFNQPTCSVAPGMYRSETTITHHPIEEKPNGKTPNE